MGIMPRFWALIKEVSPRVGAVRGTKGGRGEGVNLRAICLRILDLSWRFLTKVRGLHLLHEELVLWRLLKLWIYKICFRAEAQIWVLALDDLGPCPLDDDDLVSTELASGSLDLEARWK